MYCQTCFNVLLKGIASKCNLLISSGENVRVNIDTSQTGNSGCEKLLGIYIDCKLRLTENVPKQGQKLRH